MKKYPSNPTVFWEVCKKIFGYVLMPFELVFVFPIFYKRHGLESRKDWKDDREIIKVVIVVTLILPFMWTSGLMSMRLDLVMAEDFNPFDKYFWIPLIVLYATNFFAGFCEIWRVTKDNLMDEPGNDISSIPSIS